MVETVELMYRFIVNSWIGQFKLREYAGHEVGVLFFFFQAEDGIRDISV